MGEVVSCLNLDLEILGLFNEQMAELGNNLKGFLYRGAPNESGRDGEDENETIRQSLKGLDAYAIAE